MNSRKKSLPQTRISTRIVRPLRGGQVTIPAEFRRELGLGPDAMLQITLDSGELRIKPVHGTQRAAGSPWLKELYDLFAPVRARLEHSSEVEIDEAIQRAVDAVRRQHD